MSELVPVRVRDCACPDTPHADEGDLVYLLPTLPFDGGILAEQQMLEAAAAGDGNRLNRMWLRTFLEYGATGWNLTDEDGEPVPFDLDVLLADWRLSRPAADRASDLYAASVMEPFQTALAESSPTGQTGRGTSRTRARTSA
jgi:hypothetical protein